MLKGTGIWMTLHFEARVQGKGSQKLGVAEQAKEIIEVSLPILSPVNQIVNRSVLTTCLAGFQKLQTLLDDIGEAFDSLPAEVSADYLSTSRYFSSVSEIGQFPLLSPMDISKLTDYALRVKSKKRIKGEEWDLDTFSKILRLVERVMREGDDLPAFRETRNVVVATKMKKGKKNSQSPDLDDKSPVKAQAAALSEDQLYLMDWDMDKIAHSGSAAVCALTLLDLDGLPKQVSNATRGLNGANF